MVAGTGPRPIKEGSQPADAVATIRAIGFRPSSSAFSADITRRADAPSEMAEEFPAVTVPPFGLKAGRSLARFSTEESGRTTSSLSTTIKQPSESCPSTGTNSFAQAFSTVAL